MIVNLAAATREIMTNAKLHAEQVNYVIFYNSNDDEYQKCSFVEFMEVAEDINYDEHDSTFIARRIIQPTLSIVADEWVLRRSTDDEDIEGWIYIELPIPEEELGDGEGEFDVDYVIADLDIYPSDYAEMVKHETTNTGYVKANQITINGDVYVVSSDQGIDKVISVGKTAVITGKNGGRYWTQVGSTGYRDPAMLFHPELIKMVMEGSYHDRDLFNTEFIENELGVSCVGLMVDMITDLTVVWVDTDKPFTIAYEFDQEIVKVIKPSAWLHG